MHTPPVAILVLLVVMLQPTSAQEGSLVFSASKHVAGVNWRPKSVVAGNFTCRGRREQAIVGTNASEIVIAVFVEGVNQPPEVLRYSAKARNAASIQLTVEDLDYDPVEVIGEQLPGFQRSKTCKGLNLSDGLIDSAHIYWNHDAKRFDDWVF